MRCGFVQPGAIRPGLFEIAAPGGRRFRDEPQVFRGMPELEAGRELARLDVGSLGFDDGSDGGVGEDIEHDVSLELEGLSERERFPERHHRGAQGKVGHELHGGSRSGASRVPDRAEGFEDRPHALVVLVGRTDEYVEAARRGLGHTASHGRVDEGCALRQPSGGRADLVRPDSRHVDQDLAG
jgi:hypothetical protein